MFFLLLAIAFAALKFLEISVFATLAWWWMLVPLACAMAWWSWSDASGRSKRIAMEKEEKKRQDRVSRQKRALMSGYKSRH